MNNDEQIRDAINQMAAKENTSMMNEQSYAMDEERRDSAHEKRLRRMAERQGLKVMKSRTRNPMALHYGRYWLVEVQAPRGDWRSRWQVAGGDFGLSLDELECALNE